MFSATSCALVSALRTSCTSMKTSFSVNDWTPGKSGLALGRGLQVADLEGLDALAALADDHAGTRREDDDFGLVRGALDLDATRCSRS